MLFMCKSMWACPKKGPHPLWITQEKANKANKQIHLGRCVRCWSVLGFVWRDLQLRLSHESSLRRKWQLFPTGRHPRLFTLSWGQWHDYCVLGDWSQLKLVLWMGGRAASVSGVGEARSWRLSACSGTVIWKTETYSWSLRSNLG